MQIRELVQLVDHGRGRGRGRVRGLLLILRWRLLLVRLLLISLLRWRLLLVSLLLLQVADARVYGREACGQPSGGAGRV